MKKSHCFKPGDCVRIRPDLNEDRIYGGLICLSSMLRYADAVCTISGYTIGGNYTLAEVGYSWSDEMLLPYRKRPAVAESKIVITTDGKDTTARLYHGRSLVDSETARCHPTDKFRFDEGVRIAVDRLLEKHPSTRPQHYTGKLVCADNQDARFTCGKIYQVTAGNIQDDAGVVYSTDALTAADVERTMLGEFGCRSHFIEIVETQ